MRGDLRLLRAYPAGLVQ